MPGYLETTHAWSTVLVGRGAVLVDEVAVREVEVEVVVSKVVVLVVVTVVVVAVDDVEELLMGDVVRNRCTNQHNPNH
jgi:hypothetical protein